MHNLLRRLESDVAALLAEIRESSVVPQRSSEQIRRHLESTYGGFESPQALSLVADDVTALLRTGVVQVTNPRYFGLFNPSVLPAGVVADTLVAAFNPQLAAWSHAPAANEIERYTLERLAALAGYQHPAMGAHFTSGGAEANLTAVIAALTNKFPESEEAGLAGLAATPLLYFSKEAHHSFEKITRVTGLGRRSLRPVAVGADMRLDVGALRQQIRTDRAAGHQPFMVVATFGTTAAGAIDPVPELAALAAEEDLWLHVDAAWGGAALLSPTLRPHLQGIEHADSITWDAHKWLSVPMGAGMFFCRNRDLTSKAFAVHTGYMPQREEDRPDPYESTLQWSRRFIGLKLFMSLAERGVTGYAKMVEHQIAMGDVLRSRLRARGWVVVNDSPLPVVCFTHSAIRGGQISITEILRRIYERGDVWISSIRMPSEQYALRACITSFHTNESDIEHLCSALSLAVAR